MSTLDANGYLNVRQSGNINSAIIGKLNNHDKVDIISEQNGWYLIVYKGSNDGLGWVSSKYITLN